MNHILEKLTFISSYKALGMSLHLEVIRAIEIKLFSQHLEAFLCFVCIDYVLYVVY